MRLPSALLATGAGRPTPCTSSSQGQLFKGNANEPMAMDKFCISGGHFRHSVFTKLEEWECCNQALLVEIDPATKTSRKIVEYVSPKEVSPDELPSFLFKYASAHGDKLYTCTATEVIIYDLPSLRVAHYITLSIFNDLH